MWRPLPVYQDRVQLNWRAVCRGRHGKVPLFFQCGASSKPPWPGLARLVRIVPLLMRGVFIVETVLNVKKTMYVSGLCLRRDLVLPGPVTVECIDEVFCIIYAFVK